MKVWDAISALMTEPDGANAAPSARRAHEQTKWLTDGRHARQYTLPEIEAVLRAAVARGVWTLPETGWVRCASMCAHFDVEFYLSSTGDVLIVPPTTTATSQDTGNGEVH